MSAGASAPVHAQSVEELRDMSITALSDLDVSSVTKSPGALADAPGAIYVITHDDIVRSGTLTLPGILRLAPNLQVMRNTANGFVITARGQSGNPDAQNFANKLLVLIDGRSVYSPLFSGVYWDMQDVLPEDIDRIEVVSGPGATLWGANAVNGVINIITRRSGTTQGLYATGVAGNRTYDAGLRYGGRLGGDLNYRIYGKARRTLESNAGANDGTRRIQGGFRIDWSPSSSDDVMLLADVYDGVRGQRLSPDETFHGQHMVARWNRTSASGSTFQLQGYYDRNGRETEQGGGRFGIDTFDLSFEQGFALGSAHRIVWGGGARVSRYDIDGANGLDFVPDRRTIFLGNIFAQDSIVVTPSLTGIVGVKLEQDPFSGLVLLPNARLAWKPSSGSLLWASVSRAIRAPAPFDHDVSETLGGSLFLVGSQDIRSEKLIAYEAGTRLILSKQASLSVSAFYNVYDDLRSIEFAPVGILPLRWGNGIRGESHGLDAWADVRVADWWRLKPGYSLLIQKFRFEPGSSGLLGVAQVGNDPRHRATLRSSMDIGARINVDADLRYVSPLPDPYVPSYVEMGLRLGWQFIERAELSVSGFNLLHDRHRELPASQANAVARTVFVALKWHM
ncbi:TonB-dependent receptor [Sphingobium sufflavum]|nr:TonB-dependent receptor [Sphingobium sufflavum]MCE7797110.1 TonB-dependent receptor [Sphingobium sufflavum]